MARKLNGLPGEWEVWKDSTTGQSYLVYMVDELEPPVPMMWSVSDEELQAGFGPGIKVAYDQTLTTEQINGTGALNAGDRSEIDNDTDDPFDAWVTQVEAQAAVRPWLRDQEVLALVAEAAIEGRAVETAEFQQTGWWRSHNDAQRNWLLLSESDPATAAQTIREQQVAVASMLREAGISDPSDELIDALTMSYVTGDWGQHYLRSQVVALSDPYSGIALDETLGQWAPVAGDDDLAPNELDVQDTVRRWLGPVHGQWAPDQVGQWASRIRRDPTAADELEQMLRQQRLALFPEYENENLSYEDIAGPWRGLFNRMWGSSPDETDPLFTQVVRTNDMTEAERTLRSEGVKRGNGMVLADMRETLGRTHVGQQVRSI